MVLIHLRAGTPRQAGLTLRHRFHAQTGQVQRVSVAAEDVLPRAIAPAPVLSSALNDYAPESHGRGRSLPRARRLTGFAMVPAQSLALLQVTCNQLLTGYHRNLCGGV